jgi:hypothetical protein
MKRYRELLAKVSRKLTLLFPLLFSLLSLLIPLLFPWTFVQPILFIGNSLTFVNQLPFVLAALVFDSNTSSELKIGEVVKGGASLEELYEHTDAIATIEKSGPWTDVVLQEQSDVAQPDQMQQYANLFSQSIRRANAHTLIFETWVHNDKLSDQARVKSVAQSVASSCGGTAVFAGEAFELCRKRHPEINLYSDDRHPTQAGTYLAACVFYAKIFGRTPVGLPSDLSLVDDATKQKMTVFTIPATTARDLQNVALECLR